MEYPSLLHHHLKTGKFLELGVDIHNKSIIFGNTHDIADWISIQNEPKALIRSFLIITSNHNKYIGFTSS